MTRIIAGVAGSIRLEVPKAGTRPTSDRVREAIFSSLDSWGFTSGHRVLDLYAGSGALGLEAASRGAIAVTFVERHAPAALVIERNAKKIAQAFRGATAPELTVVRSSVQSFLETASQSAPFDVVLIDPPYDIADSALAESLGALQPLLSRDAVVLVERDSRSDEPVWPAGLVQIKEKRYGDTRLWWAEATQ